MKKKKPLSQAPGKLPPRKQQWVELETPLSMTHLRFWTSLLKIQLVAFTSTVAFHLTCRPL
jgi:hypothetical protein